MGGYRSVAVGCALLLSGALAACAADGDDSAVAAGRTRPPTSERMRAATGLSHLPIPADEKAFDENIRRHYPAALLEKKVGGAVLVDLDIDDRGIVRNVDVVDRPATPDVRMVLVDKDPRTGAMYREVVPHYDAEALGSAARAVMREVRFEPALKEGRPVPFKMRMTITFEPPAA